MKPDDRYNSWYLNQYCSLICMNPFSLGYDKTNPKQAYELLSKIFPVDNARFEDGLIKKEQEEYKLGVPALATYFLEFLDHNYKWLHR